MNAGRHIEVYLNEDVSSETGWTQEYVVHKFSIQQTIDMVQNLVYSLSQLLTPEESKDLRACLVQTLVEQKSGQDNGLGSLTIHQA